MAPPGSSARVAGPGVVPVLRAVGVSKSFGATRALTNVDLASYPGEVHAVVGQNGAGKSTLMNVFAGVYPPSAGFVELDGRPVRFGHPAEARRAGIRTVYQAPDLIPHLTVAENLYLGEEPGRGPFLSRRRLYQQAEELVTRLGLAVDVRQPAAALSASQQHLVTVARALASPLRVLILDEPTAALGPHEVDYLFGLVEDVRAGGAAVLYISHRLEEVVRIADRVSVLRDGRLVWTGPTAETSREQIVRHMTGEELPDLHTMERREGTYGPVALEVEGLTAPGLGPIDLEVRAGEVLGLGGLVGSGRSELLRLVFGADRPTSGEVRVGGVRLRPGDPLAAVAAGLGFVTEERLKDGLAASLPVRSNLCMTRLDELGQERSIAERLIAQLDVRGRPHQPVSELSGGNQQKVVLGKWLKDDVKVLLVDEPTQGVDVGAKAEIHAQLRKLADAGVAVLLVSSDIAELVALSDRVLVMRDGRVVRELGADGLTERAVVDAAVG